MKNGLTKEEIQGFVRLLEHRVQTAVASFEEVVGWPVTGISIHRVDVTRLGDRFAPRAENSLITAVSVQIAIPGSDEKPKDAETKP